MWNNLSVPDSPERSEVMAAMTLSDEELLRRLQAHPHLRNRMESLLLVVEDEAGDLKEADAAELRVIEEIRRLGQETLTAWARRQVEKSAQELSQRHGVWREGKKNCAGTQRLATSK
jgi:membrane-bound ClpP family serine protease